MIDYVGEGYSRPREDLIEAIQLLAKIKAILLDPVYADKQRQDL